MTLRSKGKGSVPRWLAVSARLSSGALALLMTATAFFRSAACGPFGTPECDSRDARKLRVECRPYAREQEDFVRRAVQTTGCADVWPRRAKMCAADPEATTYRGAPVFEDEAALHAGAP